MMKGGRMKNLSFLKHLLHLAWRKILVQLLLKLTLSENMFIENFYVQDKL